MNDFKNKNTEPDYWEKFLKNEDFNIFVSNKYCKGIEKLTISSLNEFNKIVEIFKKTRSNSKHKFEEYYYWRGQRNVDWELKSSYDRTPFFLDESGKNREKTLEILFEKFKEKLIELQNSEKSKNSNTKFAKFDFSDPNKKDEIWAVGQHYDLPTPLLDWTKNPYIAAYFAFYKNNENKNYKRVVYAFSRKLSQLINKWKNKDEDLIKIDRPVGIPNSGTFDKELNIRLAAQEGVFTKTENGRDIESNVKIFYDKKIENKQDELVVLLKINLTDNFQQECLDFLKEKQIKHPTLFPDYNDIESCKIKLAVKEVLREIAIQSLEG